MSENGTPDKHLLDQIERVLEDGQASGNPLLDDLASRQPQTRPNFRQSLEERLIARMQVKREGEIPMVTTATYTDVRAPHRSIVPFTLAAALLALVITMGLLIGGGGRQSPPSLVALAQLTSTPEMVNIVIAKQNLPRGYRFPDSIAAMTDVADYAAWSPQAVPANTLLESANGLDTLRGKILCASVYVDQPVLTNHLVNSQNQPCELATNATMPVNMVAISVPISTFAEPSTTSLSEGDEVDIYAALNFQHDLLVNTQTLPDVRGTQQVLQTIVHSAIVLDIGPFPNFDSTETPPAYDSSMVTLAVQPEEVVLFNWFLEQKVELHLTVLPLVYSGSNSYPPIRIPGIGNVRPVIMALKDIPAGTELSSSWLMTTYWQEGENQKSLFDSVEQVRGLVTTHAIKKWQPVLSHDVTDQSANPTPVPVATSIPEATPHVTQFNMTGLRPVVITRADIPRGTKIAGNVVTKLAIVLWPNEMVPEGAFIEMLPLAGMIVKNDIHQWQPILAEDVTDTNTIPRDKIAVSIPAASITSDLNEIRAGDYVDVVATYLYADVDTAPAQFQQVVTLSDTAAVQAVTQRMVKAALVAAISEMDGFEIITLAVSEQEAATIIWLVDAKLPITLRKVDLPVPTPAALPPYILDVPLDAVNRMWAYPHEGDPDRGVRDEPQVGDRVNVAVGFVGGNTVGARLDLEPLVDSQPSWFMVDPITGENLSFTIYKPTNPSPQLGTVFVRQIVRGAEIIAIKDITSSSSDRTYNVLTLEVPASSADLAELKSYIEARLPYLVMRSD